MQVIINDTAHKVPFSLDTIPLGKYVEWYDQYGRDLDNQLNELSKKKYDGDFEDVELNMHIDIDTHIDNECLSWISFFTGFDLFDVRNEPFVLPLLHQYKLLRVVMRESLEAAYDFPLEVEWNGDIWQIQDFKVNNASQMNFNEIITSKEVMRQMYKLGKGKWDAMPYLCAVFFRKKGEAFSDELIQEGSERLTLMQQLPMTHAVQVAFFLNSCADIWKSISQSSPENLAAPLSQN